MLRWGFQRLVPADRWTRVCIEIQDDCMEYMLRLRQQATSMT